MSCKNVPSCCHLLKHISFWKYIWTFFLRLCDKRDLSLKVDSTLKREREVGTWGKASLRWNSNQRQSHRGPEPDVYGVSVQTTVLHDSHYLSIYILFNCCWDDRKCDKQVKNLFSPTINQLTNKHTKTEKTDCNWRDLTRRY